MTDVSTNRLDTCNSADANDSAYNLVDTSFGSLEEKLPKYERLVYTSTHLIQV